MHTILTRWGNRVGEKLRIDRFLVSQVQVNQPTQVVKLLTRFWDQNLKPD